MILQFKNHFCVLSFFFFNYLHHLFFLEKSRDFFFLIFIFQKFFHASSFSFLFVDNSMIFFYGF